jgi:hypothetical protein
MTEQEKRIIKILQDDFDRADKIIQDVKSITTQEVIPAISELRYSGWHLVRWLDSNIKGKPDEEALSEAKAHSKRAIFEASRFGALFCVTSMLEFRSVYGGDIMPEIIANYSEKMRKAEESRKFLISVSNKERDVRADACYEHFLTVKEVLLELICCQPELNKLKEQKQNEIEAKQNEIGIKQNEIETLKKNHRQMLCVTIIATVIAIITAAITAFK